MSTPSDPQQQPETDAPREDTSAEDAQRPDGEGSGPRVVVVGPDGVGVASADSEEESAEDPTEMIDQPAKVMRIGTMIKQLLDELREGQLDDAARTRLTEIHERSLRELQSGLSEELVAELDRITQPFADDPAPTDAELRIAHAQLVGWLEGLFRGIQTAMVAQQMAHQAQRAAARGLPPGIDPRVVDPRRAQGNRPQDIGGTGQYL